MFRLRLILIIVLLLPLVVFSQNYFYKTYGVNDGLPSSYIYRCLQDNNDYMWFCSENGVSKFNGVSFKTFTIEDGLPNNDIWFMEVDSKNRLWLSGYMNGLYYIENDSVKIVPETNHLEALIFTQELNDTCFFEEKGLNKQYFLTHKNEFGRCESKIMKDESRRNAYYQFPDEKICVFWQVSKVDRRSGSIFFIAQEGKREITFNGIQTPVLNLPINRFSVIAVDDWVFKKKNDSILVFVNNKVEQSSVKDWFGEDIDYLTKIGGTAMFVVRVGNSLRVYKDIISLERDEEVERKIANIDKRGKINYLYQDREQNIWAIYSSGKVSFSPFNNLYVSHFIKDDVENVSLFDWIENAPSYVYIKSRDKKLYSFNKKTKKIKQIFESTRCFEIIKGSLIVKTPLEFVKIDSPEHKVSKRYNFKRTSKHLVDFKMINDSLYLNSYFSYGIFSGGKLTETENLISEKQRISAFFGLDDLFVSCSAYNMYIYNTKDSSITKNSALNTSTGAIASSGFLLGTYGKGIFSYDRKGKLIDSCHYGRTINQIFVENNTIYIATEKGLFVDQYKDGKIIEDHFFSHSNGLATNEIYGVSADSNSIYVVGFDGVSVIDKGILKSKQSPAPKIYLNTIKVNDKIVGSNIAFNWNNNSFEFQFEGVSFYSLGNIFYEYQLEGLDSSWIRSVENKISYPRLKSGAYTFKVRSISVDGVKSENKVDYNFVIRARFTEKLWFKILVITFFGVLLAGIVYFIQRRKRLIILRKKELADIELKALRSQMNPHFIFNSLSAIQSIVFLKGEREANKYIGTFSKLIRKTLDNSRAEKISLRDEFEYIELYLQLEKRRLNDELAYTIDVDNRIELDEVFMHTMIIQPLVENSIIHGLGPKNKEKVLTIKVFEENQKLVIVVKDNGIGRNASNKLKKDKEYKSWASSIMNDRIGVLNIMNEQDIEYEIVDLVKNNEPLGTEVIIKIPL